MSKTDLNKYNNNIIILNMSVSENTKCHNVIIIGSGPAGYSAGVYTARAELKPILFEGTMNYNLNPGGQLTTTTVVENYLGFNTIDGYELSTMFKSHAEKFGLEVIPKTITKIITNEFPYKVIDEDNIEYLTKSIVIATGADAKRLYLPNEDKLWHNGISACATCDGALPIFRMKPIAVIGGGDTAMEYALFLSKYASVVYLIHRQSQDKFKASKIMLNRVLNNKKITLYTNYIVNNAHGDQYLEKIELENVVSKEVIYLDVAGLFYGIGHTCATSFLKDSDIALDNDGYVITEPGTTKTNIGGIFAAGDVQDKKYKQAITAAGSGCMASFDVEHWLNSLN